MHQFFDLAQVLAYDHHRFFGDCFITDIAGKNYSFIKGLLGTLPRRFNHPLFDVHKQTNGCYLIRQTETGHVYVGSSGNVYVRLVKHKWHVSKSSHENKKFDEIVRASHPADFELIVFFTKDRDEAYQLEQVFVNQYKDTGYLINIAHDVRYAMLGREQTPEHRFRISQALSGHVMTDVARQKLIAARKTSVAAQNQLAELTRRRRRPVKVADVEYESATAACTATGMSQATLAAAAMKSDSGVVFLTPPKSNRFGLKTNPVTKQRMSEARKNSPRAKEQYLRMLEARRQKILLNEVLYNSVHEAATTSGIPESTLFKELRKSGRKKVDGVLVLDFKYFRRYKETL